MDWRSVGKDYLGHWDIDPGKDIVVTIKKVGRIALNDIKTHKPGKEKVVIWFEGAVKQMISNVTNNKAIANITGTNDTSKWVGTKISLYRTTTAVGNETKECIRVRPNAPAPEPTK